MEAQNNKFNFSNPQEIINFLTSKEVDYSSIYNVAESLLKEIPELHTNLTGNKFQLVSQCILEAFKRLYGFSSTMWFLKKS